MPRESFRAKKERLTAIIGRLETTYPDAHCELFFSNPLELLIATILSAQATDKQVNLVTPGLFKRYKSAGDFAEAPLEELESAIRNIGLYKSKARNIKACCRELVERHHGVPPRTLNQLIELDGVGRKTANVVLGNAYQIEEGVVVDTHVRRLSQRLRITAHHNPEKIEADLMKLVDPAKWTLFSHLLIWHGRRRCYARNPDCGHCEVQQWCPSRFDPETFRNEGA